MSGFVEWAVDLAVEELRVGPENQTLGAVAGFLWDVDDVVRFLKLATNYEHLLNHEEQVLWSLISRNEVFFVKPPAPEDACIKHNFYSEVNVKGNPSGNRVFNLAIIRYAWDNLRAVARGESSPDILPREPMPTRKVQPSTKKK